MTFILAEDDALKAMLGGITVSDEKSGYTPRPVVVYFSIPDIEVRQQTYPYITIDLVDIVQASDRQHAGIWYDSDNNGTATPNNNVIYRYYTPATYDLIYQVTSYSRHPYHDRAIMVQILRDRFSGKFGSLAVPNGLGTEVGYRSIFLEEFTKRDYVADASEGGRRLFRNVFTVRVISEMTPAQADAVATQIVATVKINTTPTYIPSGYQPV